MSLLFVLTRNQKHLSDQLKFVTVFCVLKAEVLTHPNGQHINALHTNTESQNSPYLEFAPPARRDILQPVPSLSRLTRGSHLRNSK